MKMRTTSAQFAREILTWYERNGAKKDCETCAGKGTYMTACRRESGQQVVARCPCNEGPKTHPYWRFDREGMERLANNYLATVAGKGELE